MSKIWIGLLVLMTLASCRDQMSNPDLPTQDLSYSCDSVHADDWMGRQDQGQLFATGVLVTMPAYSYALGNMLVYFGGEGRLDSLAQARISSCCDAYRFLNLAPLTPNVRFQAPDSGLIVAAIVKGKPQLNGPKSGIANLEDIVWYWDSELGTGSRFGRQWTLTYTDGSFIDKGEVDRTRKAPALLPRTAYSLIVFGWNRSLSNIVTSSRIHSLITGPIPTAIPAQDSTMLKGRWSHLSLVNADNTPQSPPFTSFQVVPLADTFRVTLFNNVRIRTLGYRLRGDTLRPIRLQANDTNYLFISPARRCDYLQTRLRIQTGLSSQGPVFQGIYQKQL